MMAANIKVGPLDPSNYHEVVENFGFLFFFFSFFVCFFSLFCDFVL